MQHPVAGAPIPRRLPPALQGQGRAVIIRR